jgi:endonuclease-3
LLIAAGFFMKKKERYDYIISYFSEHLPEAETELFYDNPFQLLVAVILSAQCTDKRVNMVTPHFFEIFPDAESLAAAEPELIFPLIKSISYPNNKAKHLSGMAKKLMQEFQGIVPEEIEELTSLPGVGRKTANVIASVVYRKPAMAVDTHVFRVSNRIGLTKAKTPLESEKQLVKNLPEAEIPDAHHLLILHGRYCCKARTPDCASCPLTDLCFWFSQKHLLEQS